MLQKSNSARIIYVRRYVGPWYKQRVASCMLGKASSSSYWSNRLVARGIDA